MKKRDAYARAGVDVAKVRQMQSSIASTLGATFSLRASGFGRPLMKIGHYAGLIDIGYGRALALHTDGVGTKVLVAMQQRKFDTIGIDCIAMTVNDLVCIGAEPMALLDYLALPREDEGLVSELTKGLVEGARQAGAPIVGGETAIMSNVRGFDLVSMGVGLVRRAQIIDGTSIAEGDVVIGLASSGLHSNGYTLARKVLFSKRLLDERLEDGATIGEALLSPTRIYVKPVLAAIGHHEVHGIAHITGGAFTKLTRLVPGRKLGFSLEEMPPPPIFEIIQRDGGLSKREMYGTFNMGVGLCLCAPKSEEDSIVQAFEMAGLHAFHLGVVSPGSGVRVGGTVLTD